MNNTNNWVNKLNLDKVNLYPLQFANVYRIRKHKVVFIFDEVGTGKTISAGIMALDYLENNPLKSVLIITANSLVQSNQFLNDWFEKLPFDNFKNRVSIINNHESNIKKKNKDEGYGLIVIDEAHVFLNKNTQRYVNLNGLKADKLIIMTASPIKKDIKDLNTYNDIAINILQDKSVNIDWRDKLKCVKNKPIISSTFDISSPITRYFKDTVVSINEKGLHKNKIKRAFSLVWTYNHINEKNNTLLKEIRNILQNSKIKNSHFVIFTRFVDKEAYSLGEFLKNNGFKKSNFSLLNSFSYYIVTGSNRQELGQFSRENHLPTILIVTYQIAEQGINLPGFNYVINYNISAYPSSLEQRFGRIDRMCRKNAQFEQITMCYLLNVCSWEINTCNFYTAIDIYIKSLIQYIPSKNVLLYEDIIKAYIKIRKTSEEYLNSLFNSLEELSNNKCTDDALNEIKEICIDDETDDFNIQDVEKLKKVLNDKIREVKTMLKTEEPDYKGIEAFIKKLGNRVFYYYQNSESADTFENIISIDYISTHKMAESIMENESFQKYCVEFNNNTKFPILFNNYRESLEEYFENLFINNNMRFLDFLDNPCKYIPWNKFNEEFVLMYNSNLQTELVAYIKKLPFFIMCKKYTRIIEEECNNISIEHCSYDPFRRTLYRLFQCDLEVSNKFKTRYCFNLDDLSQHFKIYYKDNGLEASEWLKLFYMCMKASKCISKDKGLYRGNHYIFYSISLHGLYFTKRDNIRQFVKKSGYNFHKYCYNTNTLDTITQEILKNINTSNICTPKQYYEID